MKRFATGAVLAAALLLVGCAAETPAPEPTDDAPVVEPSTEPSAPPAGLAVPAICDDLVSLDDIHELFGPAFIPIHYEPGSGDPELDSFTDRGGLSCIWGIPDSDAGAVIVSAAQRATADDATQIAMWQSQGLQECLNFMDACFYEDITDEIGSYHVVHVLVEGFEVRSFGTTSDLNPILDVIRVATTNMGYV